MAGENDTAKGGAPTPTDEEERDTFTVEGHSLPQHETKPDEPSEGDDTTKGATGDDTPSGDDTTEGSEADADEAKAEADAAAEKAAAEKKAWEELPEGVRKRMARNNRKAKAAEELAARAAAENEELRARLEALETGKSAADDDDENNPPDPDDFDDMEDYETAKAEFEKKAKEAKPKKTDPEPRVRKEELDASFRAAHGISIDEFDEAQGDLREAVETVDPDLWEAAVASEELGRAITPAFVVSLSEVENPAGVLQHLMEHPDEAAKLAKKTPFGQARALAKLEAKLGGDGGDDPDLEIMPARKTTAQGEPIEPVNSRGRVMQKAYDDMSQAEYEKARNEEDGARTSRFGWGR